MYDTYYVQYLAVLKSRINWILPLMDLVHMSTSVCHLVQQRTFRVANWLMRIVLCMPDRERKSLGDMNERLDKPHDTSGVSWQLGSQIHIYSPRGLGLDGEARGRQVTHIVPLIVFAIDPSVPLHSTRNTGP